MTEKITGTSGTVPDHRRHERLDLPVNTRGILKDANGNQLDVVVNDLSGGGAGLLSETPFDNDSFVELHLNGMAPISGRVARKFVEGMGIEFALKDQEKEKMGEEVRNFRLAVTRGQI